MGELASKWTPLETKVGEWLSTTKASKLQYRNSHQAIPGFPTDGFRSDGLLTDETSLLAVEIEVSQSHPDTNVGKYWLLYDRHQKYKRIILIHVDTPGFDSYGHRKNLGAFYNEKMKVEVPIEYRQLGIPRNQDFDSAFEDVKAAVARAAEELFGPGWRKPS